MPFQPVPRERVVAIIERVGPVQPLDLRRELKEGDTVLFGAILSEMVASGILAISKTRRGGSPFYYVPDKPESLERISEYLGEKDRRTYALLKEQKVLREDGVDPLTRVSLKNIPDFSRRFEVDGVGFWRYYLVPEEEARKLVGIVPDEAITQGVADARREQVSKEKQKPADTALSTEPAKKTRKPRAKKTKAEEEQPLAAGAISDTLLNKVEAFAKEHGGLLTGSHILKKDHELTCTLTVPGPFGHLSYFVHAISKKPTEKAIMQMMLAARGHGLPLLVLAPDVPRKAESLGPNVNVRRL